MTDYLSFNEKDQEFAIEGNKRPKILKSKLVISTT